MSDTDLAPPGAHAQHQSRDWQAALRAADAIARARDYDGLLAAMHSSLAADLPFDSIALEQLRGDGVQVVAARGLPWTGDNVLPAGPGALDRTHAWSAADPSAHPQALVRLPLTSGGEPLGLLLLGRAAPQPFTPDELHLLEAVVPYLAHGYAALRAQRQIADLATAKDRLSLLLIHDLKTPLSILKFNLDLMEENRDLDPAERNEILEDMQSATRRLLGMVADLLDISRAEEGQLRLNLVDADVAATLVEAVKPFRSIAARRSIVLHESFAQAAWARIDVAQLRRVVENILSNGQRYTPANGMLGVAVVSEAEHILVVIENSGHSIPAELRQRIFEKYGTVDEKRGHSNHGLGLYFCRLVVELHGGSIRVDDRPGGGTRFELRLPKLS